MELEATLSVACNCRRAGASLPERCAPSRTLLTGTCKCSILWKTKTQKPLLYLRMCTIAWDPEVSPEARLHPPTPRHDRRRREAVSTTLLLFIYFFLSSRTRLISFWRRRGIKTGSLFSMNGSCSRFTKCSECEYNAWWEGPFFSFVFFFVSCESLNDCVGYLQWWEDRDGTLSGP